MFQSCQNLEEISFYRVNFYYNFPYEWTISNYLAKVKRLSIMNCALNTSPILMQFLKLGNLEALRLDIDEVHYELLIKIPSQFQKLKSLEISTIILSPVTINVYSLCFQTMMYLFANNNKNRVFEQFRVNFPIYLDYSLKAPRELISLPQFRCLDLKIEGLQLLPWRSCPWKNYTCIYEPIKRWDSNVYWMKKKLY